MPQGHRRGVGCLQIVDHKDGGRLGRHLVDEREHPLHRGDNGIRAAAGDRHRMLRRQKRQGLPHVRGANQLLAAVFGGHVAHRAKQCRLADPRLSFDEQNTTATGDNAK